MTDPFINDLAKLLAERLSEPASDADDFVRLAAVGEPVRRAVALLDAVPVDIARILAAYETALAAFHGSVPTTLDDDAMAVAAEFDAYRAADDQDGDVALALILELDAIVATTVAAERTGRLPHGTADAMAARLEQTLAGISYRAPRLAQLAEDRWLTVGDDPEIIGAYGWLDVLAEAAPSRARVAAVVNAAAEHERRVEDALAILSRARSTDRARHALRRSPAHVDVPRFIQAQFATANVAVPKHTPLIDDDDLSVFIEESGAESHLVVAFVPPLWPDDARAALDALALPRVNAGPHEFRFALPEHGGQLRLELQFGDDVISHVLELRRPT